MTRATLDNVGRDKTTDVGIMTQSQIFETKLNHITVVMLVIMMEAHLV